MILYNITYTIEREQVSEWKQWMLTEHIPAMMARDHFTRYRMTRMITDVEEHTYSIQYTTESLSMLKRYIHEARTEDDQVLSARFGDQVLTYTSVMRLVNEG